MIPLSLFANRTFSSAVGTQFLMSASIYAAAFVISEFFQLGLGNSPLTAGLKFLPWTATPLVFAPLAGHPVRPRRRARAGRARAADAGRRLCLDRRAGGGPRGLLELHRAVRDRRHRDLAVDAVCGGRRSQRRAAQSARQGCRHDQHAAAVRRGVRGRNRDSRVQRPREPGQPGRGARTASSRRLRVAAGLSLLGAFVAIGIRRSRVG